MSFFVYAQRLFSSDTLDTRFTASSWTPLTASGSEKPSRIDPAKSGPGISVQDGLSKRRPAESSGKAIAQPSKWATLEYFSYYLVIGIAVPWMFKSVYDVSLPSHPNYSKYEHLLSPGWILGRKVDNSDQQYSGFRDNIPYMILLLIFHPLLRRLYEKLFPLGQQNGSIPANASQNPPNLQADARLDRRVRFDVGFACIYLLALHGASSLKILVILYVNYSLAKRLPQPYLPPATWVFNIGTLFANELCKGFPYTEIARFVPLTGGKADHSWGSMLDSYGGLLPRWEIMFNITVLRLISFNLDYYWSLNRVGGSPMEKKQLDQSDLSERNRVDLPAKPHDYSFRNYFAYVLYSPLFLTGPILTFNDYLSQLRYTPRSISSERTILYGIRFLISLLTMEIIIHFLYAVAISKSQPAWEVYTPFQLSMLGYFNLHHIWLKLLLPWRFFRLWALLDGIDPPENMVRCMSDNYSALAFWRGWHRSFNRWIVRYIYIPLGGSGGSGTHGRWGKTRAVANMLAVFTFVALWHDIQLRLLIWGWLVTLFVLPEVLAGYAFPKRKWQSSPDAYRRICGIGAVGNILMMMAANLVGFAVGLDGLKDLLRGIVGSYSGLVFIATASVALFTAAQVMFELREHELRNASTPLPSHIWLGDDILNHALHQWIKGFADRRHGSAIPGPLEARKRTTKRRMMDLRPAAGGLGLHPGILTGLDLGQENQQGWQWQPPTAPQLQDTTLSRSNDVPLPPWMMEPEADEDEAASTANVAKPTTMSDSDMQDALSMEAAKGKPEPRPLFSSITQILQSESLDEMRKIIGTVRMERRALRRKCSIVAFEQLLKSGRGMDEILEFLGDRVLNQRGARNLTFFVAHCLETFKIDEMRVFCKWVARQLYVGRYSDSALFTILQSLFNMRHENEWQMVLDEFCRSVVQALRLSPVMHIEHLDLRTWSSFVGVLFHDSNPEEMVDIGLGFLESSSGPQLDHLTDLIWPIIENWIQSWDPLGTAKVSSATLTSKIIILLQLLPLPRLVETVTSISRRLLDRESSNRDFRTLRQKHSIWWSAVRSPDAFPYIRNSDSWLEIARALRGRQDEDIASLAVMEIQKHLEEGNLRAAYLLFLESPQVSLDQCPDLAEALILDSEEHAKDTLELSQTRRSMAFSEVQNTGESHPLNQIRQERVDLLERMALAYAKMCHTRPSFAFRCVYDCWSLHQREYLGPVGPGMARALVESGIIRPLEGGRRLVSEARLEWILLQVAEAEGKEVMSNLEAAVWHWRDGVVRQMESQRYTKRREAIEQQRHEQKTLRHELDRWNLLDSPASVGRKSSPNRQESLERPSEDYDTISPSGIFEQRNRAQQSERVSVYKSFPAQASSWSPEIGRNSEHEISVHGFPGISSSTSQPLEGNVSESLEQDHADKGASALPPETSNDATQDISRDSARERHVNFRAFRTTQQPEAIPIDSSTSVSLLDVAPEDPAARTTNYSGRADAIDALLQRLESAALAGSPAAMMLDPDPWTDVPPELPSIPPCSLGPAAAGDSRNVDPTSRKEESKSMVIRKVVGTGLKFGVLAAEEPCTFSTALQPALGAGIGVDLRVRPEGERAYAHVICVMPVILETGNGDHSRAHQGYESDQEAQKIGVGAENVELAG
ncbi:MAG: hypothetical protein Q9216_000815 [Gyalolechia sp. 2 TL-2023]